MTKKNSKPQQLPALSSQLFYSLTGFLVVVLPFFYLNFVNDRTLMPRLLLLDIFLLIFTIILYQKRKEFQLNFSILRNPLLIIFSLNVLITFVSQFFAINFAEGFFDTVKTFTMVLLCFLLIQMFLTTPDWPERISLLALVAAIIALIIGFYQYFSNVVFNTLTVLPDGRPAIYLVRGLMSHKNQFSSSLMLMLPFVGMAILKFKSTVKHVSILVFTLIIVLLTLLETRSVWVGTLVGGFIFVFALVLLASHFRLAAKMRWLLLALLVVTTSVFAGIVISGGGANQKTYLDRLKSITNPNLGNNVYRLKAWKATIEMIKDKPVTGVGAGNWKIYSQKYFSDKDLKQTEINWIRPHNDFLWAYSERGILGFVLFLALFAIPVFYAIKLLVSKETQPSDKMTVLLLLSGLLAYMFESVFNFPYERINQQVYFTLFLAGISAEYLRQNPEKELNMRHTGVFAVVGLLLIFSIIYGVSMVKSEYHIVRAKAAMEAGRWKMVIDESTKAKTPFRTLEPDASAIEYYTGMGFLGLGKQKEAIHHYSLALEASPFDPFTLSNMGKAYIDLGMNEQAVPLLQKTLNLLPDFYEAKVNLGTAYYNLKEYRKSLKVLKSIKPKDRDKVIKGNIAALKKIISENPETTGVPDNSAQTSAQPVKQDKTKESKNSGKTHSKNVGSNKKQNTDQHQNMKYQKGAGQKKKKTNPAKNDSTKAGK